MQLDPRDERRRAAPARAHEAGAPGLRRFQRRVKALGTLSLEPQRCTVSTDNKLIFY